MTIKETAGKMLLYFYQLQRTVPLTMPHRQVGFIDKKDGGVSVTSDKKWLTRDLLHINPASSDIFNAFLFLLDKGLIQSRERVTAGAKIYVGIQLSHAGVDIVEAVDRDEDGQRAFTVTFNIPIRPDMGVDGLVAENLSSLVEPGQAPGQMPV